MNCPKCKGHMERIEELSAGMGNQEYQKCRNCRIVVLMSGNKIDRIWDADEVAV